MSFQVSLTEVKYNVTEADGPTDLIIVTNGEVAINFDMMGITASDQVVVDWGDDDSDSLTMDDDWHELTHTYSASGVQTITISNPESISGLKFGADVISNLDVVVGDYYICTSLTYLFIGLLETEAVGNIDFLPLTMETLDIRSTTGNITGSVTRLVNLVNVRAYEPLSGDLSSALSLQILYMGSDEGITIVCDVTNLKEFLHADSYAPNSLFTGSWDGHTKLQHICVGSPNTWTGDISNCTNFWYMDNYGDSSMTGDLTLLTKLVRFRSYNCNNAFTGDLSSHTLIEELMTMNDNSSLTKLTTIANKPSLGSLQVDTWEFSAAEVNQILADKWADRDAAYTNTNAREFRLAYGASEAPTGQGVIDKAALEAYRSPNDDPTKPLWYILTN